MKNFLLGVLSTLLVLSLAVFAYLRLGFAEVRADVPPSRLESALLAPAVRASVRRHAPQIPNPFGNFLGADWAEEFTVESESAGGIDDADFAAFAGDFDVAFGIGNGCVALLGINGDAAAGIGYFDVAGLRAYR